MSKCDAAGNVVWTRQLGTTESDISYDLATDAVGNVFITGYTEGSLGGIYAGGIDAFLSKYDTAGTLLWTRQLGGGDTEEAYGMTTDVAGNVFITGYAGSGLTGTSAGWSDVFVSKYDTAGNLGWIRQLGTSGDDQSFGIATDAAGNLFITGYTGGSLGATILGHNDAFIIKFGTSTGELTGDGYVDDFDLNMLLANWGYAPGIVAPGQLSLAGGGAAVDDFDLNVLLVHWTGLPPSQPIPEPGSALLLLAGCGLAWRRSRRAAASAVLALALAGPAIAEDPPGIAWIHSITTSRDEYSYGVATDEVGNVFITGTTSGSLDGANVGNYDAFVRKYDPAGNLAWMQRFGSAGEDRGHSVATVGQAVAVAFDVEDGGAMQQAVEGGL